LNPISPISPVIERGSTTLTNHSRYAPIFLFQNKMLTLQKKNLQMEAPKPKKMPCGQCNFEKIRTQNYTYVDKTRFIEQLESEPNSYHFLIRPRKFEKTLFLSVLEHYYDVRYADKFDSLFGDLYIGKNPTPKRNVFL
jgi:hypothetical protein